MTKCGGAAGRTDSTRPNAAPALCRSFSRPGGRPSAYPVVVHRENHAFSRPGGWNRAHVSGQNVAVLRFAPRITGRLMTTAALLMTARSEGAKRQPLLLLIDSSPPSVAPRVRRTIITTLAKELASQGLMTRRGVAGGQARLRIEALLAEAKRLSREFREKQALAELAAAEAAYREAAAALRSVKPLIKILLMRAQLEADAGNDARARVSLRRALVLDPQLELDPVRFQPRLVKAVQGIRRLLARSRGQIRVSSRSDKLPVLLDGRPSGTTPLLAKLPAGEHFVVVSSRGRVVGQSFKVRRGRTASVSLDAVSGPPPDSELQQLARSLRLDWAARLDVVRAAPGAAVSPKLRLLLRLVAAKGARVHRVRSAPFALRRRRPALRGVASAARNLIRGMAPRPPVVRRQQRRPRQKVAEDESIVGKWWFWTAIGGAALAAGGVTAAVLLSGDDDVRLRLVR